MSRLKLGVLIGMLILVGFIVKKAGATTLAVDGYVINAKGTGGSPVAVGTSTPVTIIDANRRCNWAWSWTEAGNLRCQPFPIGTTAAASTPTATHGFIMKSGQTWTDTAILGDPSMGWQCVSDSGTLNISTAEFAYCLKKGPNP